MKKAPLVILASLSVLTSMAYAQADNNGVVSSTDPQRIAEVQQHARQLQEQQQNQMKPVTGHHHHGIKHHGVRHHGAKHHHHKKAAPAPQQ